MYIAFGSQKDSARRHARMSSRERIEGFDPINIWLLTEPKAQSFFSLTGN